MDERAIVIKSMESCNYDEYDKFNNLFIEHFAQHSMSQDDIKTLKGYYKVGAIESAAYYALDKMLPTTCITMVSDPLAYEVKITWFPWGLSFHEVRESTLNQCLHDAIILTICKCIVKNDDINKQIYVLSESP